MTPPKRPDRATRSELTLMYAVVAIVLAVGAMALLNLLEYKRFD